VARILTCMALLLTGCWLLFIGFYHTLASARYQASARLKVQPGGSMTYDPEFVLNQAQLIQSELILRDVSSRLVLGFDDGWANPRQLDIRKAVPARVYDVSVRIPHNTSIIAISAGAEDPERAAEIANTLAAVYQAHCDQEPSGNSERTHVELLDHAVGPRLPAFPNRYIGGFSIFFGTVLIASVCFLSSAGLPATRMRANQAKRECAKGPL
jgi:uncharacterized protein involved in exopolysaccharide biosynthesis